MACKQFCREIYYIRRKGIKWEWKRVRGYCAGAEQSIQRAQWAGHENMQGNMPTLPTPEEGRAGESPHNPNLRSWSANTVEWSFLSCWDKKAAAPCANEREQEIQAAPSSVISTFEKSHSAQQICALVSNFAHWNMKNRDIHTSAEINKVFFFFLK